MSDVKKIVAVRFEGTLATCSPSESSNKEYGEVNEDGVNFIKELLATGKYEVYVVSTGGRSWTGRNLIRSRLDDMGLAEAELYDGFCLPVFDIMVDDKSFEVSDRSRKVLLGENS